MRSTFPDFVPGLALQWSRCALALLVLASFPVFGQSIRFFGTGAGDVDRVKVLADSAAIAANVGSTDITVEFWIAPDESGNDGSGMTLADYYWIGGNVIVDRDRYNQGRAWGVSLHAGRIAFGLANDGSSSPSRQTWRGTTDLRDGDWHHIVIQRARNSGAVQIYVDGLREVNSASGPVGDISYPSGAVPGSFCTIGGVPNRPCTLSDPYLVIGAEKHDADAVQSPSYSGRFTEFRLSRALRYSGATISVPTAAFTADGNTALLYHFDEGAGTVVLDSASDSNGTVRFSVDGLKPQWSTSTPFGASASAGSLQFASAGYSVTEGAQNVLLSVTRTGGTSGVVAVNYATAAGTAASGSDFSASAGTLQWADGSSATQIISIPVLDDSTVESPEAFTVSLSGPTSGALLGGPSVATVTIADDDPPPATGTLQFTAGNVVVTEGQASATLSVSRTSGSAGSASVNYATANGTAASGSDYSSVSGTLTWSSGDTTTKVISVPIANDAVFENTEAFRVNLSGASGAVLGAPTQATVTINDNDSPPPAGTLQFAVGTLDVIEGQLTVQISVSRANGSAGAASVSYSTVDATARAGSDYSASAGTLSWANGESGARAISVAISDDAVSEAIETFALVLSGASGAVIASPASLTVSINDNDAIAPPAPSPAGNLRFSTGSVTHSESQPTLMLSVERVNGAAGAASVTYALADGTAVAGSDFGGATGTLTWGAGDAAAKVIPVQVLDDAVVEGNETFVVTLTAASGAALGSPSSVVVTLADSDATSSGGAGSAAGGGSTGGGGAFDLALLLAGLAAWRARGHEAGRDRGQR